MKNKKEISLAQILIIHEAPTGRWYHTPAVCEFLDETGDGARSYRDAIASARRYAREMNKYYGEDYHYYRNAKGTLVKIKGL